MATVSISLSSDLLNRLDTAAQELAASRSWVVKTALRRLLSGEGGERPGDAAVPLPPVPRPDRACVIEIDPRGVPHVAVALTWPEATRIARTRRLRWAVAGLPHEVASTIPPLDATASECSTAAIAGALAIAPAWCRCLPTLVRQEPSL